MIFAVPLALLGLAILPPLYFILRATPPAPQRLRFPPVALLQNMPDAEQTPHRLPLWLLLLRLAAAAALILGFAGPTLHPPKPLSGTGPILLVIDNGWAAAGSWANITDAAQRILSAAQTQNRAVAILATARDPSGAPPHLQGVLAPNAARQIIIAMQPEPWPSDRAGATLALQSASESTRIYLSDGITGGPDFPAFLKSLHPTRSLRPILPPALLGPPTATADGKLHLHAIANPSHADVLAIATTGGILGRAKFNPSGDAIFSLPPAIQNSIAKFTLDGTPTAGGTVFTDSGTRIILAGLDTGSENADSPFLGTLYFLRRALPTATQVITGSLGSLLAAKPGVIFLADTPLSPKDQAAASTFIASGGILIRFAGPLTAQAPDPLSADPLISGDRRLGGSLTWTQPAQLGAFSATGPFSGMAIDPNVTISQQILADPTHLDPATIWATLADGTPLILGKASGAGYLVNILTTANTTWSNLSLSGLYPTMLARLVALGQGVQGNPNAALRLQQEMNGYGILTPPSLNAALTPAKRTQSILSPAQPPGLYGAGTASLALNLAGHVPPPVPAALANAAPFTGTAPSHDFGPDLITLALLLLALDLCLSMARRGALPAWRPFILCALILPASAHAQSAALQTQLGYILTGDPATDQISNDGLAFLSANVSAHTSVQLGPPAALDPAQDDLGFYPLIYWPLAPGAPTPSATACTALVTYMSHGGLLIIDMPGGDSTSQGSGAGLAPGAAATFTRATACLDLPPLEPLTTASVLAHSFYIIPDFPGRFSGGPILVASSAARDADGVTPIMVSQNDWAGAWARDASGAPEQTPLPGGEDQRIIADRFGINLIIYALTGSYKADQNAAPALLDRLSP
jgi:hypothetical protein